MNYSNWITSGNASKKLGINKETLIKWRELGYLHQGTHWRKVPSRGTKMWFFRRSNASEEVIYHLAWCEEVMQQWKERDARIPKPK